MKKLTNAIFLMLALVGATTFTSCNKDDDDNHRMNDQEFVTKASSSNMFEIAAGSLAVQKGTDADVKAFGQHMVTDHGQAAAEMTALARQKGWTLPTEMLQEHRTKLTALTGLSGAAFDNLLP